MQLQLYEIMPALLPYVKIICTMEADQDTDYNPVRVLPDGCVEIFLNYTNSPVAMIDHQLYTRSIVSFRMNRYADVQMRKGAGCIAICFYPGMAYRFFSVSMTELANTTIALSDLWKATAVQLEDRLALCNSAGMRVHVVQRFLADQLASSKTDVVMEQCLCYIQRTNGSLSVRELDRYAGFSQRQLSRKFRQALGLSAKEYLRVSRFIHSLSELRKYPNSLLTEIAHQSGYYDQAHFIRDCKDFSGYTPGGLLESGHVLY